MVYLLEYEAKSISKKKGIKVPEGVVVSKTTEVKEALRNLSFPVAVKVQVPMSGRGKAGGVKFANSLDEAENLVEQFLGRTFQGRNVLKVLVEEKVDVKREFYIGVADDTLEASPIIIVTSEGGMDVEEVAVKYPDRVAKMNFSIRRDLIPFQARRLAKRSGIESRYIGAIATYLCKLWKIYKSYDCTLTEINPLVLSYKGDLLAVDARIILDDNAMFRHGELRHEADFFLNERERIAKESGWSYVEFNPHGEVAYVATGAGLSIQCMDLINEAAPGVLTFFVDVGARFVGRTGDVLKIIATFPNVKAVLFHRYGGFGEGGRIAESIVKVLLEQRPKVPVIIQISGTGERDAMDYLRKMESKLEEAGVTFQWTSHLITGNESRHTIKGGVDTTEGPIRLLLKYAGYRYQRNSPSWLPEKKEWEEVARTRLREVLRMRPEKEYQDLANVE